MTNAITLPLDLSAILARPEGTPAPDARAMDDARRAAHRLALDSGLSGEVEIYAHADHGGSLVAILAIAT